MSVGTLRASVHAQGSAAADFINDPDRFNVAGGNSISIVEWGDELTVFGSTGSTVSVLATVILSANGGHTTSTTADTYTSLEFRFLLPSHNFMTVNLDDLQGGHRYEQAFLLNLSQGTSYNLSASLSIEANAAARINDPNPLWKSYSFATLDAGHTARLFLEVLTPGASYELASGADLSHVPEPATSLLVFVAIAGWCLPQSRSARRVPKGVLRVGRSAI
ncbi:MAG: hypothetical protein R3C10_23910 [Pirellulales bacterium]